MILPSTTSKDILEFWFRDDVKKLWFQSTAEFDRSLKEAYLDLFERAEAGQLSDWGTTPEGALALCIILDQFPLNMFRGDARSFSTEGAAREISRSAVEKGFDKSLTDEQRLFFYLPFMHSENLDDQNYSVQLFRSAGMETRWAEHHRDLVKRFGRFPHRNAILGRENNSEEEAYLNSKEAFHG